MLQFPATKDEAGIPNDNISKASKDLSNPVAVPIPKESSSNSLGFGCNDDANDRNNLLYNDYFEEEAEESLNPYDLLMRIHFPINKSRAFSQLEKFKNYWENYSFYAIWRKKFIQDHNCQEQDLWKEYPHLHF
ncbi:unnamed protein product [Onchocerca flexuosa]|uniref:Uncharacterized protein n=1 Tax=Onchocerca flexuosa TaxID=387005 RepID=A0A183HF86_9BILA|nr:unnamed protein product [Onchocerca flexuosa]